MQVLLPTEHKYQDWDQFCFTSDDAWYWHTTDWLNYSKDYRPDILVEDLSFIVKDNNQIIAICPLFLEEVDDVRQFSLSGGAGLLPALANGLSTKTKDKLLKLIFNQIDDLANKHQVKRVLLRAAVLNPSYLTNKYNYLVKFNYLDASGQTQLLDLNQSIEDLRSQVRHGHDSDIDKSLKQLKVTVFNKDNITQELFDDYVSLHAKAAGRVTRARSTFDAMLAAIKKGNGFLTVAYLDNKMVGASLFFMYKNNVFYASSCNDPDTSGIAISHAIQWQSIEWMKNSDVKYYEIGWQHFGPSLDSIPSEKQVAIDRFKRGFGGETVSLVKGEKYYNKQLFKQIYQDRIENYANTIS